MKKEKVLANFNHELAPAKRHEPVLRYVSFCSCWFVLFVINLFLFSSCSAPFSPDSLLPPSDSPSISLPLGYGSFSLHLTNNSSRTVLPDAPVLSAYAVFELQFTNIDGVSGTITADRTNATLSTNPVILPVGTYTLIVDAFFDARKTQLAARGIAGSNITITAGTNVSANVQLRALINEGTGTFNWSVDITAGGVTSATMTIMQGATHHGPSPVTLNLTGTSSGSPVLPSGIYNVSFNLTRPNEATQWDELLYIYSSLTSSFSITFDNDSFHRSQYVVTYVFNDGVTSNGSQTVLHADTLTQPSDPTRNGFNFDGWFTDAALTIPYIFSAPVLRDITLYAKWEQVDPVTVSRNGDTPVGFDNLTLVFRPIQTTE